MRPKLIEKELIEYQSQESRLDTKIKIKWCLSLTVMNPVATIAQDFLKN